MRATGGTRPWDDVALFGAGALLVATVASAWHNDTNSLPTVLVVVAAAAFHVIGRLLTRWGRGLSTLWAVAAAAAASVAVWPGVLSGTALAPPTHYGNANGSLLAAGAVAAMGAALLHRSGRGRVAAVAVTLGLLAATFLTRSQAASAMLGLVGAAALLAALASRDLVTRAIATALGGLSGLLLLLTVCLGAPVAPVPNLPGMTHVIQQLSVRRILLWHDAVDLTLAHPLLGVGPEAFPERSPIAQQDTDTRQAHSLPLQTAAETGLPGVAGVLAVLLGVFGTAVTHARRRLVLVAAGAVCVFAAQSFVDYTYRYPAVVLGWALLTGVLVGIPRARPKRARPGPSDTGPATA